LIANEIRSKVVPQFLLDKKRISKILCAGEGEILLFVFEIGGRENARPVFSYVCKQPDLRRFGSAKLAADIGARRESVK
jgi:hypothetical protein